MTISEENQFLERIRELKARLGKSVLVLAHHYQRRGIVAVADALGDSFELSRLAASSPEARHIVFCGVHFMAESAAILAGPRQTVQIPSLEAGCRMADMADILAVSSAWEEMEEALGPGAVTPVVYMNSDAELKAFCGRLGGTICTSSNCAFAFLWAFGEGRKVFFFPDRHLGRNSGNALGIPRDEMALWTPGEPLGGLSPEVLRRARLILWDGHCHVHTRFTPEHVLKARAVYPGALVVVHPECPEEVVALADATGSTGFIVKYVREAPPGATVVVGTEINLVSRLADEYPEKTVVELAYSLCPNMFRITPENLLSALENLGRRNVVTVPETLRADARAALDRMLALPPA